MTRILPVLIAGVAERMSSKLRLPLSLSGRNPSSKLVKSAAVGYRPAMKKVWRPRSAR